MGITSYLYIKASRELQYHQNNISVMLFESRNRGSRMRTDSHSTTTEFRNNSRSEGDGISQYSRGSYREREDCRQRQEQPDNEIDVVREKRTQKYLVAMVTVYAICLCPLMVLRLAKLALIETYDNTDHFDITYTIFVWIAFLPTCTTPLLFASWQMSRSAKERLRGYFRFSNRKLRQSCETVITTAETPAVPRAHYIRNETVVHHVEEGNSDTASFNLDVSHS